MVHKKHGTNSLSLRHQRKNSVLFSNKINPITYHYFFKLKKLGSNARLITPWLVLTGEMQLIQHSLENTRTWFQRWHQSKGNKSKECNNLWTLFYSGQSENCYILTVSSEVTLKYYKQNISWRQKYVVQELLFLFFSKHFQCVRYPFVNTPGTKRRACWLI